MMAKVHCSCGAPSCSSNGYIPVAKDRPMKLHLNHLNNHLKLKGGKKDHMKFGGLYKFGFLTNNTKMTSKARKRRNQTALSIMSQLGAESNAHGLAKIATANTTRRKVMWALPVIIGFTAATIQLSLLVTKFLSFQVVEVSNMKEGMPVQFPAVTICNIATLSLTKVNKLLANYTEIMDWIHFTSYTNFTESQKARMGSNQALYENLPKIATQMGHDVDHFVIHCRFNQRECGPVNFTLFFDGKHYYNCYTFNSGFENGTNAHTPEKLLMHTTGPQNGLSLIISLDNDETPPGGYGNYITSNHVAFSAGVRAQVHAPNTMPSPADHGFDVPPGYSSSVGLKAILHSRLPHPHGNCTRNSLEGSDRMYRNTIFTCLQLCKQQKLVQNCGCRTSALPMYKETDKSKGEIPFCGTIKNWQSKAKAYLEKEKVQINSISCEEKVLENLANDRSYENSCGCFQPCQETTYEKSLSLSYWPLEFYQLSALNEFYKDQPMTTKLMKEAYHKLRNITNKYELMAMKGEHAEYSKSDLEDNTRATNLIHQNLLRLNIYLEELSIVEFAQIPAYGLEDLFADIGGTLGLWMGISVLTIVELIELIIRLVSLLFNSETDVSGTDSGAEDVPENQTMVDQNSIPQSNKYDQFQYDRPLYQQNQYNSQHAESPI